MHATAVDPREELQLRLEELFDKNQLMPRVRRAFRECDNFNFLEYLAEQEIPIDFGIDLLANMAVRKRANLSTLVGILRHHFKEEENPSQACALMLERALQANLVDYIAPIETFIVVATISDELQQELDRFQYPLPMVIPPQPIKTNIDTGYLTSKGSVILQDNHHWDDVCLDHLNRVNQVALSINLDTAKAIQNEWRNLDKQKPNESFQEYQKRVKAFEKYDSVAKDVLHLLVSQGNRVYLTHRYDKRGRTYCMGYHVNYQGTAWNKAVIEFADKEKLT